MRVPPVTADLNKTGWQKRWPDEQEADRGATQQTDAAAGAPDGHSQAARGGGRYSTRSRIRIHCYRAGSVTSVCADVVILEDFGRWLPRRLCCLPWRRWKRPSMRRRRLTVSGLDPGRAWKSSVNGRGLWWHAVAAHMNHALPTLYFIHMGLVALLATQRRLQRES